MCTSAIAWSGYVNEYEGPMDHQGFLTVGMYSIYNTNAEYVNSFNCIVRNTWKTFIHISLFTSVSSVTEYGKYY